MNTFNINQSKSLTPIDINKNYVLVDKTVSCPPLAASLKIDVDASAHAVTSVGVAVIGTIIPPLITDFAVITGMSHNNFILSLLYLMHIYVQLQVSLHSWMAPLISQQASQDLLTQVTSLSSMLQFQDFLSLGKFMESGARIRHC